jgi:hypothetical protein
MELKKILLVLTDGADQEILTQSIHLCKNFGSKLFALFVIESNRISQLASLTHQKVDDLHRKLEEGGWGLLYSVEDEAVENGVWTSLHLEDGEIMGLIRKYIENYNIDVIIIKKKNDTKKIFLCSPVPVIGL